MGSNKESIHEGQDVDQEDIKPFRFLDLPPEMRNRIYNRMLFRQSGIVIGPAGIDDSFPNILRACKQIRSEGFLIFLEINTFVVSRARYTLTPLMFQAWLSQSALQHDPLERLTSFDFPFFDHHLCVDYTSFLKMCPELKDLRIHLRPEALSSCNLGMYSAKFQVVGICGEGNYMDILACRKLKRLEIIGVLDVSQEKHKDCVNRLLNLRLYMEKEFKAQGLSVDVRAMMRPLGKPSPSTDYDRNDICEVKRKHDVYHVKDKKTKKDATGNEVSEWYADPTPQAQA
jgi:hypothetical protein